MGIDIFRDMREIVWAAAPQLRSYGDNGPPAPRWASRLLRNKSAHDYDLWHTLWAAIRPVKYGNTVSWTEAGDVALARYQVPHNISHIVRHVISYSVNWSDDSAGNYGMRGPLPPGSAHWEYESFGSVVAQVITDPDIRIQVMADLHVEEFLVFRGGYNCVLLQTLLAAPLDAITRELRTTVYGFNCGVEITDRIGSNQMIAALTA